MGNISHLNEHILVLKVDDAFAVWFGASQKFMLLEEPAYFVLKQIVENKTLEIISTQCCERYHNPVENCRQFVDEVNEITQQYISPDKADTDEEFHQFSETGFESSFYSVKTYSVGQDLYAKPLAREWLIASKYSGYALLTKSTILEVGATGQYELLDQTNHELKHQSPNFDYLRQALEQISRFRK